jgi:pimeloyl-ACP methyl ester carboxylesterase
VADAARDRESLRPFRIDIPQPELDLLRQRLAASRWPAEVDQTRSSDGITVPAMRTLVERWLTGFDWRAQEADLNRFPQVVTQVDGQRLHAVHRPSPRPGARPLVLLHGWPSTFTEYRRVIDELAEPSEAGAPAFHVVVPSLPGYGFSGPLRDRGWGARRMAAAIAALMGRLGYSGYLAHGGDNGYIVSGALARVDRANVAGIHLNLGGVGLAGLHRDEPPADEPERVAIERYQAFTSDKSGYALLNATRPQTVAYALSDSPIGQLAWIAEKFTDWADPGCPVPADEILTVASIYWFTNTSASAARYYQEEFTANRPAADAPPDRTFVDVPTAVASYPHEIVPPVRRWAQDRYNIVRWVELPAGGHFSALERPDLVLRTLRGFARQLASA